MASISVTHATGQVILASNLNTVNTELLAAINAIQPGQLAGQITQDLLQDNHSLSWVALDLLPITSSADLTSMAGFLVDSTYVHLKTWTPIVRPGWEMQLCAFIAHAVEVDTGAGTDGINLRVRRNASELVGGQVIGMTDDDTNYLVAYNDPIANPLSTLADGDYLDFYLAEISGDPQPRGLSVSLAVKHVLVAP